MWMSGNTGDKSFFFFFYRHTDKDTQFKSMQTRESCSLNPGNFLITFKHTDANASVSLHGTLLLLWLLLVLFMLGYYTITLSKLRFSLTALVPNLCV